MTAEDWRTILTVWVNDILDRRADKSWTPSVWSSAETADILGVVAGLPVQASEDVSKTDLVLMGSGDRSEPAPGHPPRPAGPYTEEMARYTGISIDVEYPRGGEP